MPTPNRHKCPACNSDRGRGSAVFAPFCNKSCAATWAVREAPPADVAIPIRGPEDVQRVCRDMRHLDRERFEVLALNARHEYQSRHVVSVGSLNASIVHPRETFRDLIRVGAASFVCVHNHPSGDPQPSEEDFTITKRLVEVGDLVGIACLDHVIIARRGVVSLRSLGKM